MKYLSVCSGIEAATVAWHPLGWQPVAFSEIEKFPAAVLKHHYPDVPNLGDMTQFKEWPDATFDVLVGGTPCQSFSVAGLRTGLDDPRGNLMLTYLAIAARFKPAWLVWENVPGVLSSGEGRDFATLLRGLGELGFGFAYRVLDAQYVRVDGLERAVPQRRRRVFVVGHLANWRRAAAVLFERESLFGHSPPRRQAGERIADSLTVGANQYSRFCGEPVEDRLISRPLVYLGNAEGGARELPFLTCAGIQGVSNQTPLVAHSLRADGFDADEDGTGRGTPLIAFSCKDHGADARAGIAPTLRAMAHDGSHANAGGQMAVAFQERGRKDGRELDIGGDTAYALTAPNGGGRTQERNVLTPTSTVRRLTPVECERLQGFPDGYTAVPYRGKPAADGPRYKALGNSMAVNCMRWIGQRIAAVDALGIAP